MAQPAGFTFGAVNSHQRRGGYAELDRNIVPVHLPTGTTPVLLKITNSLHNWRFVFRLAELEGRPLTNLKFSLSPG